MTKLLKLCLFAVLLCFGHAALAEDGAEAVYVVTHVDFTPPNAAQGEALLKAFAVEARHDSGSIRYEVLQEPTRKNHFTLVTVWATQKAFDAHLSAAHTHEFRDKIQPLLGSPFDERLHQLDQ
jgi:quinol monooxygenase YgiN